MWIEILLIVTLCWVFYKQWCKTYNYWQEKGFPYVKGTFPFGTKPSNVFIQSFTGTMYQEIYKKLEPHPFGGIYTVRKCELLARDPDFIKQVLIKDFAHFKGRNDFPSSGFIHKHLFSLEGDLWRALRIKLSPTFTSGKLKLMFKLFQDCANNLDEHFKILADKEEEIEAKDWMARFTTDIISTCAFGLEPNSIENPDNELRKLGLTIFDPSKPRIVLMRFIFNSLPYIKYFMKLHLHSTKMSNSLLKIIKKTVKYREENNITRNDFLDLLINIKNEDNLTVGKGKLQTEDEKKASDLKMDLKLMTAQCFVFFAAGFETSSSVLANCLYELTMHPQIQEKLRQEIDSVLKKHDGEISYQSIQEMHYLEQVIFETMRKYPTLPFLTRICVKPYTIPETGLVIDKGIKVIIPVYALHHNPKYHPEPEKFNPERFSPENKTSIVPFTYLPFGDGPRNCIGMRFGLLQTKTGIVTTLAKYKLIKTKNTPERLTFQPTTLISRVKDKILIKLAHRDK